MLFNYRYLARGAVQLVALTYAVQGLEVLTKYFLNRV